MIPRSERARRVVVLCGALGIAVIGYALVSVRGDGDGSDDASRTPATSEPTVLGAVITPEERVPDAPAASPVSVVVGDTEEPATTRPTSPAGPTPTTRATSPTSAPPAPTTSTEPPPTLVPPTVVENTTTTSAPTTTTPPTTEPDAEP